MNLPLLHAASLALGSLTSPASSSPLSSLSCQRSLGPVNNPRFTSPVQTGCQRLTSTPAKLFPLGCPAVPERDRHMAAHAPACQKL